jgi:hypothetical protein
MTEIVYKPSKTIKLFHKDRNFVRAIIGPIGSGKSVGCIADLLMLANEQQPTIDGRNIRFTKWCIFRNTYRELIDTTLQTFHQWIPQSSGIWQAGNMKFILSYPLQDNTFVHTEFLFRALDRPSDVKKLLSLEITGAFGNEAREFPKQIIDMIQGRCGRYPKTIKDPITLETLYGPTWHGLIMDTNPPDSDHWWYKLFEEAKPENHSLYHQPSGISPDAENLDHLPSDYYQNMQSGKDKEWINVYVHGQYGFVSDGKPVYPEYKDDVHYSPNPYIPDPKTTLYIGIDFGLTPAATFSQITPSGQLVTFDELCTFDMGAVSFAKLLKERLNTTYRGFNSIEIYADPAGEQRAQTDETTPFMMLDKQGITAFPTYTNDFTIRREVVAEYMLRLDFSGHPAFMLTPGCPMLRKAYAGGYKYKRMNVSGEERFIDKPNKNRYSHVCESHQYLFLGAVGDNRVIGGYGNKPIDYSITNRSIV